MKKKIFVDSDVIISSLISKTGAAYFLINSLDLDRYISNKSIEELIEVTKRLNLSEKSLQKLLKEKFSEVDLKFRVRVRELESYVLDPNDEHILAGAKKAKAKFLISYNIRHFKIDKIAENLNIVVLTPARFLQYLRSIQ